MNYAITILQSELDKLRQIQQPITSDTNTVSDYYKLQNKINDIVDAINKLQYG